MGLRCLPGPHLSTRSSRSPARCRCSSLLGQLVWTHEGSTTCARRPQGISRGRMIEKQSSQPRLGDPREIAAELLELRSLLDRYSTNESGNYPALSLTRQALERRVTL